MIDQQLHQINDIEFQNLVSFAALSLQQQCNIDKSLQFATLNQFRSNSPCKFYILCSQILANQAKSYSIRKFCGELIVDTIQVKKKSNNHYWEDNIFSHESWEIFLKNVIKVIQVDNDAFKNLGIQILVQLGYCYFLQDLALESIIQFSYSINSSNPILKTSAAEVLKKWCEKLLSNLFIIDKQTCIKKLKVIFYMSANLSPQNNPLAIDANVLLIPLANAFRDNFIDIVSQLKQAVKLFSQSIMCLIEHFPSQILLMYFETLATQLQVYISKIPFNNYLYGLQTLLEMLSLLLSYITLHKKIETDSIMLCSRVCFIIDISLQKVGSNYNIIGLISTAINGFRASEKLQSQLQKQYWNIIFKALNDKQNRLIFLEALRCTGDIARNYRKFFQGKSSQIFQQLTQLIKDKYQNYTNQNMEEFKEIVLCVFDICLSESQSTQFEKQCEKITMIIDITSETVDKWNNFQQLAESLEEIKDVIINFYELFYFKCQRQTPNDKLFGYFHSMWNFINKTCTLPSNPSLSFMRKCWFATFSGSLYFNRNKTYSEIIIQVLSSKLFEDMTNKLTSKNSEYGQEIITAKQNLFRVLGLKTKIQNFDQFVMQNT